jgi:hypothetical protein
MFRRVADRPVLPCTNLAAQRRRTMPRASAGSSPQRLAAGALGAALSASRRTGSRAAPVPPAQVQAARLPLLQYNELVAQDQDLCGLPRLLTLRQPQP